MIYIFLANGFEEIEALTAADVLRRGGIDVKTVGVGGTEITGAHGITVKADISEKDISLSDEFSGVILPGGMPGAENLYNSPTVKSALEFASNKKNLTAAICAAPFILGKLGLLKGKRATCYPGFENCLFEAEVRKEAVVRDGNIITANGPAAALGFALEILKYFKGENTAVEVARGMQCKE